MATPVYRQRVEPVRYQASPSFRTRQEAAHINVLVTQPGANVWAFEYPWSTDLCSCCQNTKQCCYAFFCPCCFQCELFKRSGENMWACICPGALYALRTKIRTAFRIEGDLCNDCCVTTWCPCCAAVQLTRELHHQGL